MTEDLNLEGMKDDDLHKLDPLSIMVAQEAHRVLNEAHLAADPELIAQGWQRRFMADARRVQEAVELYKSMGFEVLTQAVKPAELSDDCDGCRVIVAFQFQTIYTRKQQAAPLADKEQT